MVQMVNGYPCQNCTDISLAKRGLNPENPTNDPVKAEDIAARKGLAPVKDADADREAAGAIRDRSLSRAPGTGALVDIDA